LNQAHSGCLPATGWLCRLPLAWKIILAAALASSPFGALVYSTATGQPLPTAVVLLFSSLMLFSWYLLASLCLAFARSFRELHEAHIQLENGDFAVRLIPVGADEGTQLAAQFNDTAREVGRIVASIRDAAVEVEHATVELKGNATLVASATSQQEESITHMAAATEEMTVSIAEVASQSRESFAPGQRAVGGGKPSHYAVFQ